MGTRVRRVVWVAILAGLVLGLDSRGGSAQTAKAKDPFIGRWVLDRGNSTFSGAAPERRTMVIEAVGNLIKQIVDTTGANGATDRSEFTAAFDGKDYPISNSVLDFVSLKRISANKVERLGKRRFSKDQTVETQTREASADGKTLTFTTNGTDFDGNEYATVQIFTRE